MKKELRIKYVDVDLDRDPNTQSSMQCGGNDVILEALSPNYAVEFSDTPDIIFSWYPVCGLKGTDYYKYNCKRCLWLLETEFPDLTDNRLSFITVKNFINGLQKDLSYTFYLFGTIIAIIIITMMAIFWSFVLMYRMLFEEKLYVQYFMGFSPWKRYIGVLSLIISFSVMELIVSILVGSKLGIVMTLATFAFQIMLLYFSLFRKEGESIIQSFKE